MPTEHEDEYDDSEGEDDDDETTPRKRTAKKQAPRYLTADELDRILEDRRTRDDDPELAKVLDLIEQRSHKGARKAFDEWQTEQTKKSSPTKSGAGNRNRKSGSGSGRQVTGQTLLERLLGK